MKLLSRFKNLTQKISKKAIVAVATLAVLAGAGASYVSADFFPNRVPFDYNKGTAQSNCADPNDPATQNGRCGSMTGPVFNTFINTPSYGDERSFADARRSDESNQSYKDLVTNVTDGSQEVVIRTYVHNNANQSLNASGVGIARDTKVRVLLPTATSNGLRARSYISASNASLVEDTVDFTSTKNFKMQYVAGSAKLINNGAFVNGVKLSDDIVTTGALIGDDALDGNLPGCFDYAAVVEIRVKIVVTDVSFTKQVRKLGDTTWTKEVTTKPGDTVQWLMTTDNNGNVPITDVIVRDVLPPHTQLVAGTVKRIDATRNEVLADGPLFDGGFNLGGYGVGSGFYVMFNAKTLDDFENCEVRARNRAFVRSNESTEQSDTADVVIRKDNCVPNTPVYSCDALTLSATTLKVGDKVKVTAKYTAAGGATFKNAVFNFGDNSTFATNNSSNNTIVAEHAYAAAGNYGIKVKLDFTVNGQTQSVEGGNCVAQLTVGNPPTEIPNTGAGSMVAMFAGVTTAGAFAHNMLARRKVRG